MNLLKSKCTPILKIKTPIAVTEKLQTCFGVTMAGSPELGDTRGAQHEGVPEQSCGVQEPSHGAHNGGDGSLSQPRDVGRLISISILL